MCNLKDVQPKDEIYVLDRYNGPTVSRYRVFAILGDLMVTDRLIQDDTGKTVMSGIENVLSMQHMQAWTISGEKLW